MFDSLDHLRKLLEHLAPLSARSILQKLEGLLGKSSHVSLAVAIMELGESELSGKFAVSLSLGDIISDVVDILKHSGEVWVFGFSLGDDVLGVLDHVLNFLDAVHDVGVTDTRHLAVGLGVLDILHDVLNISHELGEVGLSSLNLRQDVLGIKDKILNILHAGSKVSSLDSDFIAQLAVSFSLLDIGNDLLSISKNSSDINLARLGFIENLLSSGNNVLDIGKALSHTAIILLSDNVDPVLLLFVMAILTDISLNDLNDLNNSSISGLPVISLGFVIDSVRDVTNSVPVRFAHIVKLTGSLDPEHSVLKFSSKVHDTFLELVTSAGNESLESILHNPLRLVAFFWGWWSWSGMAVLLGFTKDFHHSVESFLSMVPITLLDV